MEKLLEGQLDITTSVIAIATYPSLHPYKYHPPSTWKYTLEDTKFLQKFSLPTKILSLSLSLSLVFP